MNLSTLLLALALVLHKVRTGLFFRPYQSSDSVGDSWMPNHESFANIDSTHNDLQDNESEVVGLGGLAHLHALAARARARAAHARARARLHRPLLLQGTPREFLNDFDDQQPPQPQFQFSAPFVPLNEPPSELIPQENDQLNPVKSFENINSPPSIKKDHLRVAQPIPANFENTNARANVYEGYRPHSSRPTSHKAPQVHQERNLPEITVHNIDNSAEVYQNLKPGFSIIPTNWKPPPESNLYFQGEYEKTDGQEPVLAVLPGKWTHDDGYDTYYYDDYNVIPIAYDISEAYVRSADADEQNQFVGVKEQMDDWRQNHMVWRPEPEMEQRSADPVKKRHFGHHGHAHTFIHQHIHTHGAVPSPVQSDFGSSSQHAFAQAHNIQPAAHLPVYNSQFSLHAPTALPHGHQLTINKQKTTVIVPPGGNQNFQIAQVDGTNNALSQSQATKILPQSGFGFAQDNFHNSQSAHVTGVNNAVSQSQAPFVGAPYLINVPRRRTLYRTPDEGHPITIAKRSVDDNTTKRKTMSKFSEASTKLLQNQREVLNQIKDLSSDDADLLFLTYTASDMLDDLGNDMQNHNIIKRTVPLLRLIADPNAKLDMPKTLDNMGTVFRNSFENKRAPMYHLRNLASSTRDAFFSSLKIPPHDLFLPSRYKIVDSQKEDPIQNIVKKGEEDLGGLISRASATLVDQIKPREDAPTEPFVDTYKKVGSMLRDSVESGRSTLNHMGEAYHSVRKALATARHVSPRVLLSTMRIPAVQRHEPRDNKLMLISPKLLQLKQETVEAPHYDKADFVSVGHVMNSLALSNPNVEEVGRRRVVLHPNRERSSLLQRPMGKPKKYFVLADGLESETPENNIRGTVNALDNAREAIGANTLKDFVLQMKNGLATLYRDSLDLTREKMNKKKRLPKKAKANAQQPVTKDNGDIVGAGLLLPKQLKTPFMGQPSQVERRKFFEDYGDSFESGEYKGHNSTSPAPEVGAINPILFDKDFQPIDGESPFKFLESKNATTPKADYNENGTETTEVKGVEKERRKCTHKTTTETGEGIIATTTSSSVLKNVTLAKNQTDEVGTGMVIKKKLLAPFMGKLVKKEETYYGDYNGYDDDSEEDVYLGERPPESDADNLV